MCQGGSLATMIFQQMASPMSRVYTDRQAFDWALDVARAVARCHQDKPRVVHRDLKQVCVIRVCVDVEPGVQHVMDTGSALTRVWYIGIVSRHIIIQTMLVRRRMSC